MRVLNVLVAMAVTAYAAPAVSPLGLGVRQSSEEDATGMKVRQSQDVPGNRMAGSLATRQEEEEERNGTLETRQEEEEEAERKAVLKTRQDYDYGLRTTSGMVARQDDEEERKAGGLISRQEEEEFKAGIEARQEEDEADESFDDLFGERRAGLEARQDGGVGGVFDKFVGARKA